VSFLSQPNHNTLPLFVAEALFVGEGEGTIASVAILLSVD